MARGSLRKQKGSLNKWEGRIDIPTQTGKRKQLSKTITARSVQEAEKIFNSWIAEVQDSHSSYLEKTKVSELHELWKQQCEASVKQKRMTRSTRDWYLYLSCRILDKLGNYRLDKVGFSEVETFYNELSEEEISAKYIYEHFSFLKRLFEYAVEKGLLNRNDIPRYVKSLGLSKKPSGNKPKFFEDDEMDIILEAVKGSYVLLMVINIIKETGLRRSEALGLQWKHIDFKDGVINVEQQLEKYKGKFLTTHPKTKNGFRKIPMTKYLIGILKRHKKEQQKRKEDLGGKLYSTDFVITNEAWELIDPNLLTKWFRETMQLLDKEEQDKKLPEKWVGRGVHSLRHTFASNMIRAGVNAAELSAILGHHSIEFTYKTYVHLFQDSKKEAIKKFESYRQNKIDSDDVSE